MASELLLVRDNMSGATTDRQGRDRDARLELSVPEQFKARLAGE